MKRSIVPAICLFFLGLAMALLPSPAAAAGSCLISAGEAASLLGHPVVAKDLGPMGCSYVGKNVLATLFVNVFPSAADVARRVKQVRSRLASAPRRAAIAIGGKGATFVQVVLQPKDQRSAEAFLKAALGKV